MSGASRRANGHGDERPRMTSSNVGGYSSKHERSEGGRNGPPSSLSGGFQASLGHKRSASGNPRPISMAAVEERRYEERKVTERTYEAQVERVVPRTASPEKIQRRSAPGERKPADVPRQKSAEWRPRDSKTDAAQVPWNPEVTLRPHTTAPLASRVSIPPLASTVPNAPQPIPLAELSLDIQEAVIVEDLLFAFMGYEGQYIRFAKGYDPTEERDRLSGPSFRILPGLDPSLHDLATSMLKMARYYSALETFVDVQSREEFGAVNHALCAAVRKYLQDYIIMIAELETQFLTSDTFTVHVLNIHTLPTSHLMLQLYTLAQKLLQKNGLLDDESDDEDDDSVEDYDRVIERLTEGGDLMPGNMSAKKLCKGGVVLGLVTQRLESMAGDPAARTLLTSLLRDASKPYMSMLNEWLHHGAIRDPHSEFLIKEQKSIKRERLEQDYTDEYWERRYTIRDKDVPPQLEGVKAKVLLAGKYLNVVRECGGVDVSKVVSDVPTTFDDSRFLENVNGAYAHANAALMRLLLTTHALPARLRSLKHYFFLNPSDYFSHFMELGHPELRKPVRAVNAGKLQYLLDLILRQPGSVVSLDPFKEDVSVEMNEVTLIKSLQRVVNITGIEQGEALPALLASSTVETDKNATGYTSLQFDYAVPFPVSLVVSRKTVWRYQALFRYLFSLRYLESQLSSAWHVHTRGVGWAHRSSSRELERWKRRVWTLRARMLTWVQQLLYFCTAEVIEPNWSKFMSRLDEGGSGAGASGPSRTVDELMKDHVDFLDTSLKECMLTNSKLLKIHAKLMLTCTMFANYTKFLTQELDKIDPDLTGGTKPPGMTSAHWRRFQTDRAAAAANRKDGASADASAVLSADDAEARFRNLNDLIRKWEFNFGRHLQILLDALNHYAATETVVLLSLCARLSTVNQGTEFTGLKADEDSMAM
ncbi:Spc97 Spc98 [Cordyceps militaris]|uniref:Spindle pole body component n=1 Tax=Cordyceps militaris TaxID=73501 RepID=A0A2H4SKX2_CORMI|nr:Spc97 Spc98 [Cordyceps militaris]